jgi:hypothetical protein
MQLRSASFLLITAVILPRNPAFTASNCCLSCLIPARTFLSLRILLYSEREICCFGKIALEAF